MCVAIRFAVTSDRFLVYVSGETFANLGLLLPFRCCSPDVSHSHEFAVSRCVSAEVTMAVYTFSTIELSNLF